jgi:hypothetical protein
MNELRGLSARLKGGTNEIGDKADSTQYLRDSVLCACLAG